MTLMKEPCLPSLLRAGPGAGLRFDTPDTARSACPGKSRRRVLGFGSRVLLSISVPGSCSLQKERKGAELIPWVLPVMTRLPAAPGRALRGRWCCRVGNFRVTPFLTARRWDEPALRRRGSGSSASRGGGMGGALARRRSAVGERAAENCASGIRGGVSML